MRRRAFIRFGTRCSASGGQTSYTYDALGTRKSKTVNGQTTLYLTAPVYDGHQQLIEEPVATDRSKDLYLLHDGTVGNITHATTRTGTTANSYSYEPFGARTPQTAATASRYGYTGEEYDAETGLVYLRARYYDPTLGRFISPDPFLGRLAEPITQNRYVYVKNNPLGFTDPSGLDTESMSICLDGKAFGFGAQACLMQATDQNGNFAFFWQGGAGNDTAVSRKIVGPLDGSIGVTTSPGSMGTSVGLGTGLGSRYQSSTYMTYTSGPILTLRDNRIQSMGDSMDMSPILDRYMGSPYGCLKP